VLAEQHDEWVEGRRYLGIDVLARAHLSGQIPQALSQVAPDLLAVDPDIRIVEIIAVK
jgi:hypothetical protein